MKHKTLIIITILYFIMVNTSYYWEGKIGIMAFPVFIILMFFYIFLSIAFLRLVVLAIREKLTDKSRLFTIVGLAIVLVTIFFKPNGILDFDKFEGENLLLAEREGGGNCMTTLKLKDRLTYSLKRVCFGVWETKGNYYLRQDTIFFDQESNDRNGVNPYEFGIIKPSSWNKDQEIYTLSLFKSLSDTVGLELFVIKNDLKELKNNTQPLQK